MCPHNEVKERLWLVDFSSLASNKKYGCVKVGIVLRLIGDSSITFRKIDNTQKTKSTVCLEDEKQHGFDHFLISSLQVA